MSEKAGDPRCDSLSFSPHRSPHSKPSVDYGQAVHLYVPSGRLAPFAPSREFRFQDPLDVDTIPPESSQQVPGASAGPAQCVCPQAGLGLRSNFFQHRQERQRNGVLSPRCQCSAPRHTVKRLPEKSQRSTSTKKIMKLSGSKVLCMSNSFAVSTCQYPHPATGPRFRCIATSQDALCLGLPQLVRTTHLEDSDYMRTCLAAT